MKPSYSAKAGDAGIKRTFAFSRREARRAISRLFCPSGSTATARRARHCGDCRDVLALSALWIFQRALCSAALCGCGRGICDGDVLSCDCSRIPTIGFWARISYPLYVVHARIGYSLMVLLLSFGMPAWSVIVVAFAATVLLATAVHILVEKPSHRLGRRIAMAIRSAEVEVRQIA
jgi:hypothetical protein